jgi:hypothetical protein
MAFEEITRTAVQALWNHLPDQPYNWGNRASVIGQTPRLVTPLDIPEAWVAPQLRRLVRPFAQQRSGIPNSGPELEIIEREHYQLVQAEDLRAERFPNTYLCRTCGQFATVRPGDDVPACPARHGPMMQFQFGEVHNCGLLRELRPPQCANGCRATMQLMNWRALSVAQWFWRCSRCGARSDSGLIKYCNECRSGRTIVQRIPQTSAYYPQQLTVLNPPTRASYGSLVGDAIRSAAVGQLIGVVPAGLDALRVAAGAGPGDALSQVLETCKALGLSPGDPMYEQLVTKAREAGAGAANWRDEVASLGLTPEQLEVVGDEALALALAADASPLTVDDLIARPPTLGLMPMYQRYHALFSRYHLTDVTLLRELPVAHIVAGYTRVSSHAVQRARTGDRTTSFKFFPDPKSGRYPMYGTRGETEGLLVRVDPVEVVHWLVDSGVVPDPGATTADEARHWLLGVCEPVVDAFNPPDHRITEAVLGLIHSMAHRFMKALATRCGLNADSLAEYLFPSATAFLIYANTRSEFVLGGIEHVFRFDLEDALSELDADPRCVFDPPCRRSFGGACAACLHTSEVACERFNTVLDRNRLFGALPLADGAHAPPREVLWRGFWTP